MTAILIAGAGGGALIDCRTRRIPNSVAAATMAAGLALAVTAAPRAEGAGCLEPLGNVLKLVKVGTHHTGLFAYYLDRLRATPDGDGSLLDQVMVLYGSGMSNSNLHNIQNLPILLAGGGAGRLQGGRHIRFAEGTPLTNLYLSLLGKLDVPAERVGDSTGRLTELSDV